jgi:hypothetical protein
MSEREPERQWDDLGAAVGVFAAIFVAGLLVAVRGHIQNSSVAIILVIVVVAAASMGGRRAGLYTAIAATLAFDFFHTVPYRRLTIATWDDVETVILLMAVGLIVGELVVRRDRVLRRSQVGHAELERVRRVGEAALHLQTADLVHAATEELIEGLVLAGCHYEDGPARAPRPTLSTRGTVDRRDYRLSGGEFTLPSAEVALPVRSRDAEIGRFVLVPTEGVGVARDRRVAAVAVADLVGLALGRSGVVPTGSG